MNIDNYITLLTNYVRKQGISIYEYYYQLALKKRNINEEGIPEFEAYNPFLKEEDYLKLISSKEDDICKYFALAMDKTITLNLGDSLTREDIESVINDKMNEEVSAISREDIESVIDESMLENETSLSGDAQLEFVQEYEGSNVRNFVTTIGKKIAKFLNGFAVVKNEEENKTDVYSYDAKNKELANKRSFDSDAINASTGIYVNFQEYIDRMFESILNQYPDADVITFINDEGEEKPFAEIVEDAYQQLKEAGSLRFGEEFNKKQPKTYKEYFDMNINGTSDYGNFQLQKGIYVRRDLLTEFFNHYYVRALYYEYLEEEEFENVK